MTSKYALLKLTNGWAVAMKANSHIVETFPLELEAKAAIGQFERGERFVKIRREVWVIADHFVTEPWFGGTQLGIADQLDMHQFEVVGEHTQEEVDAWTARYYAEHGHYPDT